MINIIQNALFSLVDQAAAIFISSRFEKNSNEIKIMIKDEGTGIEDKILSRITEPFFTTRKDAGGTGLGLYISYSIINDHQGNLTIKSEPGKGTEITITLPVSKKGGKK